MQKGCCLKQNESDVGCEDLKRCFSFYKNSRHVYVNINLIGTEVLGLFTEILQKQSVKCYLHHIFEYLHKVVGKEEKMLHK